jgi:hypothetical protein
MLTAAAAESEATWGEGERTWLPPTWSTAETGDNETSLNLLMLLVAAAGGGNGRESAPEDTDGLLTGYSTIGLTILHNWIFNHFWAILRFLKSH